MNHIVIADIKDLIRGKKYVGHGSTCFCFADKYELIKVYRNTYRKYSLFQNHDMDSHLEYLGSISNPRFIGPHTIYYDLDGNIIAYGMPYIKGHTIDHISSLTHLSEIDTSIQEFEGFIEEASDLRYRLSDLHAKNMLYSNHEYYMIDLDHGRIEDYHPIDAIARFNKQDIIDTIIKGLFRVPQYKDLFFNDINLDELYKITYSKEYEAYKELFACLSKKVGSKDAKVLTLRRHKGRLIHTENRDSYHIFF